MLVAAAREPRAHEMVGRVRMCRFTSGFPPRRITFRSTTMNSPKAGTLATRHSHVQAGQCASRPRISGTSASNIAADSVITPRKSSSVWRLAR